MRKERAVLAVTVLSLVAIGLTVLFSAGGEAGFRQYGNSYYYVVRQVAWLAFGLVAFVAAGFFDYRKFLEKPYLLWGLYAFVSVMLVVVLGCRAINGSHRWIIVGPLRIQPCEFAKILAVVTVSALIVKKDWRIGLFWRGVVPVALSALLFIGLALKEPDFGSAFVMLVTTAALLFVGGMRILHFIAAGAAGMLGFLGYLSTNPNRVRRILAWMPDAATPYVQKCMPWLDFNVSADDADEANHQLDQALVALRRGFATDGIYGAWFGEGFMKSMQKRSYLPENHTDFIFAIGAEEWGLLFSLLVLALFTLFFCIGLRIAYRCEDRFGRLVAFGISFLIYFQALFNLGVVTGLLPTKGLALPFISYGGTNLLSALLATGMLWGIARRSGDDGAAHVERRSVNIRR